MATYEPTSGRVVTLSCVTCETKFDHATKSRGRYPLYCAGACRPKRQQQRAAARAIWSPGKDCRQCGRATNAGRIYCSRECQWASMRQTQRLTCRGCGGSFLKRKRGAKDAQLYCSRECSALAHTKPKAAPKLKSLTCVQCGSGFEWKRSRACCSPACDKRRNADRALAAYRMKTAEVVPPDRPCAVCGREFTPSHGRQIICGRRCARRLAHARYGKHYRQRARHHGVLYEPVNRLKVFERDAWRCQVCGERAPKRLCGTTAERAPELDHRVPMALGGAHSYENCQLACRDCNLTKAGTMVAGQMPLFARP